MKNLAVILFIFLSFSLNATVVKFTLQKPTVQKKSFPLIIWMHGCTQTAEEFIGLTKINNHQISKSAYILFPEQSLKRNPLRCWNWFLPENQKRSTDDGEMNAIMDYVFAVTKKYPIDPNRIYVGGFSAGAVMAVNMVSCYPDIFKGALIHSGVAYRAFEVWGNHIDGLIYKARNCSGLDSSAFKLNKILIFHGMKDLIARESFGENTYLQMKGFLEDKGDVRLYQNPDMGHAWSGGEAEYPMSYPEGQSATDLFLNQL